jgi:hypothetical protein
MARHLTCSWACGGAISWMSKILNIVVLSTIEVEYVGASHACKEAI